jgi:SdpI/YfhL protein family
MMSDQPFVIPTFIFMIVSIPLVLGLIPPNRFYGVRTSETRDDGRLWLSGNRFGGAAILLSSAVYLLVAQWLPYHPTAPDHLAVGIAHLLAFAGPQVIGLLATRRYLRRLAKRAV